MSFQISALDAAQFEHLHSMTVDELESLNIVERTADTDSGFPCRVSLEDAPPGEKVLLLHYQHQPVDSPYRASHAIYVRRHAQTAELNAGEIPQLLRTRLISARGFDRDGMMIEADVVEGTDLESTIDGMFENRAVDYLHLHYAKAGCYAARVDRA